MNKKNKRISLIIPHTDTTLELDLQRMKSKEISVHTERMWLESVTTDAEAVMVDQEFPRTLKYLEPIKSDITVFGCTSAGALYGLKGDKSIISQLENHLNCFSISAFSAVINYLTYLKAENIAVLTPYTDKVTDKIVKGLSDVGFNVSFSVGMGIENDIKIGSMTPNEILCFVKKHIVSIKNADSLFMSCTNMRALECRDFLESELGIPVVTSNSAIINQINQFHNFFFPKL